MKPKLDLLTDRQPDEAYLAADPGKEYTLYFTKTGAGSVGLNLKSYPRTEVQLRWVNLATGDWGPSGTVVGGRTVAVDRPTDSVHWVAVITK